jgi:hypothetical protein
MSKFLIKNTTSKLFKLQISTLFYLEMNWQLVIIFNYGAQSQFFQTSIELIYSNHVLSSLL